MILLTAIVLSAVGTLASAKDDSESKEATPFEMERWAALIQKDYPASAIRAREEGRVGLRVRISAEGRVTSCFLTHSSGSEVLDEAACRGMRNHARYTPASDENGISIASTAEQSIRYVLPNVDPKLTYPVPVDEADWRAAAFSTDFDRSLRDVGATYVVYQLVLDESGRPVGCGINVSSGDASLDRLGCAELIRHALFEPAALPDGSTIPGSYWVGYTPKSED